MKEIITSIGLPGSGKSTVLKKLSEERGWPLISPDAIRKEMTGTEADQTKNASVWDSAYKRIAVLQASHDTILFDATLANRANRLEFIREARPAGMDRVSAVYFHAPYSVLQERNSARERVVPEHAMLRMHEQLTIDLPKLVEGEDLVFDRLVTVQTDRGVSEVYAELQHRLSGTIDHELSKFR